MGGIQGSLGIRASWYKNLFGFLFHFSFVFIRFLCFNFLFSAVVPFPTGFLMATCLCI